MCVAVFKPFGKIIPEERLRRCMSNNGDGAGFAIIEKDEKENNELNVYKGYFDFDDFWKAWQPHQEKQALLHFRVASGGLVVDGKNCHPFRVDDDLVLVHNGRISHLPEENNTSDTAVFVEKILKPFRKMNPDFWLMPEFQWFIENAIRNAVGIGSVANKLVMMDVKGRYFIFNAKQGNESEGVWYSNYSYSYTKNNEFDPAKWGGLCGNERDIIEGDIIDAKAEIEETRTNKDEIDFQFETSDVLEIDEVLEKYQQKQGALV